MSSSTSRDAMQELARYINGLADLSERSEPYPASTGQRRRRGRAVALAVALLIGAAIPLVLRKADDTILTASAVVAENPALVVIDDDLRLHVQGANGSPRTSDLDGFALFHRGIPVVSVRPDRESFFVNVARTRTPTDCGAGPMILPEVVEIDIASNARNSLGIGAAPRLSPDGRLLAFFGLTSLGTDCSADQLIIQNTSDGVRSVYPLAPTVAGPQYGLDLWWTPDGSGVVVASSTGDESLLRALTMSSGVFRDVRMPDAMDFAGFLGRPDIALGVTPDDASNGSWVRGVWKVDLAQGRRLEKLFDVERVFDSNTSDGFVDGILPNQEGDEVLITKAGDGQTRTSILSWHQGDPKPVVLVDRAVSAAWVSGSTR